MHDWQGAEMAQFALHVNGTVRSIEADGNMPLLWALRDLLELTGTKYGCGIGMCGACTVHLNGSPARSCQTSLADVRGQKITTIEGLGKDGLNPVQKAWIAEQAPQCGYCQSGQIMSAAALLASNPNPTDSQIDDAMAGNICRCGTYFRIRRAIHRAAQEIKP
jgi:isoquinoline 1-oxidoreductase alpha subunit